MNQKIESGVFQRLVAGALLVVMLSLSAPTATFGQTGQPGQAEQTTNPANGFAQVTVKRTSVAEVDASHVRIAVELVATAKRGVTLENLRLTELRLNGLPVYADALTQPIELLQDKETSLPPIYVTIQIRDLTSTAPLREMIVKQMVHVEGRIVADLQMGFLDKLAMHVQNPRVSLPLTEDVPVTFAGSPFARQAALGVLAVIDFGMKGSAAARKNLPGMESAWVHSLETEANQSLYRIESSYVLKERGRKYPVGLDQLGFRLASGLVIATAEVKAPWEYDTEFLGRMKSGEAKLEKNSNEIQLLTIGNTAGNAGSTAVLELSRNDFTLNVRGDGEKDTLIVQKMPKKKRRHDASNESAEKPQDFAKVNVRRRASPNSLALIELRVTAASSGFHVAPEAVAARDRWDMVAVYRLIIDAVSGKFSVEVIQLSAHRDGQQIRLDQPVDASFYGSPILTPDGVIGFVQDEQVGAFLPADLIAAGGANP